MRLIKTLTLTALAAVIIAAVSVFPHGPCFKNGLNYTFYCGNGSVKLPNRHRGIGRGGEKAGA
jgi:hypothetical protein